MKAIEEAIFKMMTSAVYEHLVDAVAETAANQLEAIQELSWHMKDTLPGKAPSLVDTIMEPQDLLLHLGDRLLFPCRQKKQKQPATEVNDGLAGKTDQEDIEESQPSGKRRK